MHFTPGLRDDHRRSILLREPEIFIRELVGLFAQATRDNRTHLVEAFKRFAQLARRRRFHRLPIPLDAACAPRRHDQGRVLPTNLVQFDRLHSGMALDGEQRIRSLNRSVLSRVAGKNHAGIPLLGQPEQVPAFDARQSARPRPPRRRRCSGKFTLGEKAGDRGWRRKSRLLHVHDLLTLRRENDHRSARLPKLLDQFVQDKALACSSAAAKDRNEICRSEQRIERLALFVVEFRIRGLRIRHQRPAITDTFLRGLNDFPFAQQHVAHGHFTGTLRIADVATLLGELLEFGNGKLLATRPAQRLLPHLAFQHDRVAVEQMFLRPLNRFGDRNGRALSSHHLLDDSWTSRARSSRSAWLNCASHSVRSSSRLKSFCFRVRFSVARCARRFAMFAPASSGLSASSFARALSISASRLEKRSHSSSGFPQLENRHAAGCECDSRSPATRGRVRGNRHSRRTSWRAAVRSSEAPSNDSPPRRTSR